jgi:endonuclease YncB( thermonuclease family)
VWQPAYQYRAEVVSVRDGDTVTARIDLGFHVSFWADLRLLGLNAPELKTGKPGIDAREHLTGLISRHRINIGDGSAANPVVIVRTKKDRDDKYGRMLAELVGQADDGSFVSLNDRMIRDGHAVPYMI